MEFNEKILRIFFGGIKGLRGGYKCEIFDKIFIYNILFYVPPWKNAWKSKKKKQNKKSTRPIEYLMLNVFNVLLFKF